MIDVKKFKILTMTGVLGATTLGTIGSSIKSASGADAPVNQTVPAKPEGKVVQAPASIAADLSKDVTAELNDLIKNAPDGSTIVFLKDAKYKIEGTLLIENKNRLTIDGQGALFRSMDSLPNYPKSKVPAEYIKWRNVRNRAHWRVKDSSDITIRNIEVHGPHIDASPSGTYDSAREAQHAIDVDGVKGLTIEKVKLHDLWGDGIYLSGKSQRIVVRDSDIRATGRQGIAIAVANDILIENNDIGTSRRGLIDIEPYGKDWASGDVRIIGNRFGKSRLLALPMGGGGDIGMVLVANNTFSGPNGVPLVYHGSSNPQTKRGPFLFVNNTAQVNGSPSAAFYFGKVQGVFVAGNKLVFPGFRGMTVAKLTDATAGIFGNVFAGAKQIFTTDPAAFIHARSNENSRLVERGNNLPAWLSQVREYSDRERQIKAGEEVEHVEEKAQPTQFKQIPGGYAAETVLQNGARAIAVVRSGDIETARKLSGYGLSTEAKMAWVLVEGGKVVESYVMEDGQFTYRPE